MGLSVMGTSAIEFQFQTLIEISMLKRPKSKRSLRFLFARSGAREGGGTVGGNIPMTPVQNSRDTASVHLMGQVLIDVCSVQLPPCSPNSRASEMLLIPFHKSIRVPQAKVKAFGILIISVLGPMFFDRGPSTVEISHKVPVASEDAESLGLWLDMVGQLVHGDASGFG